MNKKRNKRIILIDLDGVLNNYKGRFDENVIPPIKEGAKEFLEKASKEFCIKIFTTRNKLLTARWLIENNIDEFITDITDKKELSWLYIDDRCIQFKGDFNKLSEELHQFEPWYKLTKAHTN